MPAEEAQPSWSRRDLLLVPILIAAAGVQALSLVLGRIPWNSDQGIVALMGRHIARGVSNPIFCYGSYYGGTLEPHLTALVFSVFGANRVTYRLSLMLFLTVLLGVVYSIGRRFFGRSEGMCAAGYLALPPFFLLLKGLTSDGAYDSLAILGAGIIFAALRLDEALETGAPARRLFALLGIVAGLAWWVLPLSAYFFIAVALWFLIVRPAIFLKFRHYPMFTLSFLLGSLPWWIANLKNGWLSLKMHELTTVPVSDLPVQFLRFFSKAVPVLFGARSSYNATETVFGAIVALTIFVVPLVLTVVWIARTGIQTEEGIRSKEVRESRVLLLLLILIFSMHVFTSLNERTYLADPRFLFPIYVPFSLILGFWIVRIARTKRWPLALAAGLAVVGFHTVMFAKTEDQEHWPTTGSVLPLVRALEERGLHDVYTGYWTAYRLAFESEERIRPGIFGVEALDRYPAYTRAVDLSTTPAIVLYDVHDESTRLRDYLARMHSRARSVQVGPHRIFWGFEPTVLHEIRRAHGVPSAPTGGALASEP
jgi:4-amino-4-deoxy-L-arabinose transferase-like glycosyltransferase